MDPVLIIIVLGLITAVVNSYFNDGPVRRITEAVRSYLSEDTARRKLNLEPPDPRSPVHGKLDCRDYPNPYDMERWDKVVHFAKAMTQDEIGIIEGVRYMAWLGFSVGDDLDLYIFHQIVSQTDHLPVGKVRELWSADALLKKDKEIAQAEQFYKQPALDACQKLIQRFKDSKWIRH